MPCADSLRDVTSVVVTDARSACVPALASVACVVTCAEDDSRTDQASTAAAGGGAVALPASVVVSCWRR